MADSDPDDQGSDDDVRVMANGAADGAAQSRRRALASRPKGREQARWEAAATSNWDLQEAADGSIEGILGGIEEAGKRKRYACRTLTFFAIGLRLSQTSKGYYTAPKRHHSPHAPNT